MRRWNRSIRAWLASLGAAVALPLLLLLIFLFVLEFRREETESRAIALRVARNTAAQIASQHATSAALLEQLSRRQAIRDFDGGPCDSLFAIVDFFPQWPDLLFYDREGKLVCSANPRGADALLSQAAQQSIAAELRRGELRSRQPLVRHIHGRWISIVMQTVAGSGGAARGTLVLLQAFDFHQAVAPLPNTVITILDREGDVVARSAGAPELAGRNAGNAELAKIALREREGVAEASGLDGVSRQYGFTRVPALQWTVFAGVPTAGVMKDVRELYFAGLGGALLFVAVAVVITLLVVRLSATFDEMVERRTESERNVKGLSERLLTIQEEERRRVAREIHDDLGQSLTALKMDVIGFIEKSRHSPDLAPLVARILRTLDSTVTSVQRISSELRPSVLDDLGLFAAIESEARLFEERTGIECELSVPEELPELAPTSSAAIYRIFQEAMTNVARHSNATRVEVHIRQRRGELLLEVRDDGRGIESAQIADPASLGLVGVHERAAILGGTAHVEGVPGRGTLVSIRIPTAALGAEP